MKRNGGAKEWGLRVGLLAVILGVGLTLLWVVGGQVALADGGPHGGYQDVSSGLPDQCAACHRVHQGQSVGKLLKAETPYALCLTCHNGAGSRLDVLDGVKLAATVAEDAAVIRSVEIPNQNGVHASVAPSADVSAKANASSTFTLAVRNPGVAAATVALAVTADSNGPPLVGAKFNASTVSPASLSVPAASGGVPGVAYATVTTTSNATAALGDSNVTTVTATIGTDVGTLKLQTKVGDSTLSVLNGGGFLFLAGSVTTSKHNADPADNSLNPWGYNANTGQNTNALSSPLQCTSCHNPHGTQNYRLLREKVNTQTVVVRAYYNGAFTKDEGARGLETGVPADKYTKEYYGSAGSGGAPITAGQGSLASLCGACHTAYPSSGASAAYTAGGVTHYRHKTEMPYTDWLNPETGAAPANNPESAPLTGFPALRLASSTGAGAGNNTVVTCLTCHQVHGTATTMSGYALKASLGGTGGEDLTPAQTSTSKSVLLFTNNRGMCEACHQW